MLTANLPVERQSSLKEQVAPKLMRRLKTSGAVGAEYLVPSEHSTVALRTTNVLGTVSVAVSSMVFFRDAEGCCWSSGSTICSPSARPTPSINSSHDLTDSDRAIVRARYSIGGDFALGT
eukprot:2324753-Prymnesium_polylepis.1